MQLHKESHLDHGLTAAQLAFILLRYASREAFFIDTVELPIELGTVPCGLFGPIMGDDPVPELEVSHAMRGARTWTSRLVRRDLRPTRLLTLIAGPHEEDCGPSHWPKQCVRCDGTAKIKHACILYTVYGGPLAPQEPGDPGVRDLEASAAFWRDHALTG